MRKAGHTMVGVGVALATSAFQPDYFSMALVSAGAIAGASAPDWLEISRGEYKGGRWHRVSVIPHRTITHWVPLWVIGLFLAVFSRNPLLLGFMLSGLAHLLTDFPNPMGVPVVHPWKRVSLRWWRSGENDGLLGVAAIGLGLVPWMV